MVASVPVPLRPAPTDSELVDQEAADQGTADKKAGDQATPALAVTGDSTVEPTPEKTPDDVPAKPDSRSPKPDMSSSNTSSRSIGMRFTRWFRWSDLALIPLVFGIALQLRAWLTWRPLWFDEQTISRNIRDRGFAELATVLDHNQAAPIAWLWTQRAVVELAGTSERALRFVPFLLSAGCLILAWLAVRRVLGPVGTFVTVALFSINDYMVRYAAEVKQYSGDVFFVLLMIVLARWALTAPGPRRFVVWWAVAAGASLFSMGAILAMPGLALVLVGTAWWHGRWRLAWWASLPSVLWLVAFAPHYLLTMGPLRDNDSMTQFWARRGYAPVDAGQSAVAEWMVRRLEVLANQPLGLDAAFLGRRWLLFATVVFWSLAVLGMLVALRDRAQIGLADRSVWEPSGTAARRPATIPTGLLFAAPVVSGFALAVLWVSPLYMRLAMWIMPGLFLAVGFAVDAAARLVARGGWGRVQWSRWAGRLVGAGAVLALAVMLAPLPGAAVSPPAEALTAEYRATQFEYRGAVRWLIAQHRPGDLVVGVYGGHHAVAWYDTAGRLSPVIWVQAAEDRPCDPMELRQRLAGVRRVLFYADLRVEPNVRGAEALAALLEERGTVVSKGDFGPRGIVSVVDLDPDTTAPPDVRGDEEPDSGRPGEQQPCLRIVPM